MPPLERILARACAGLMAGLAILLASGAAIAQDEPSPYGKTLVRSYELPADLLDRYNDAVIRQAAGGDNGLSGLESWTGSTFNAGAAGSPYTLVVRVLGAAVEENDLGVRWQPSWSGTPVAMPGAGMPGAKPGERLQMTTASEPFGFTGDRLVAPGLALAAAKNIRMDRVRIEVWSGVGETPWFDPFLEWWPLLAGAMIWTLLLVFLRYERQKNEAAKKAAGEDIKK